MTSVCLTQQVSYSTGMSPGMAPRTLIVCLLALGVSIAPSGAPSGIRPAFAEPAHHAPPVRLGQLPDGRPDAVARQAVAVIDLTNEQPVRDVANRLLELLAAHPDLAPPAISDGAALVDKLPADDDLRLAEARKKLLSAKKNLSQRNFREAAIDAVEGQESLLRVTPPVAIAVYADLEFALGQSRLGEQKDAEAREAFALTRRLDPARTLDDLHYLPEVVQAFDAARTVEAQVGMIKVHGKGKVWIDGQLVGQVVGSATGEFPAAVGRHVVWLTHTLRETAGKEVVVTATRPGDATILDGTLTRPQKVVRLRIALAEAKDPAARSTAMNDLAAFINVHDAVLLMTLNGKIVAQTWRDRDPGFGELRELRRDRPGEILAPLEPPPPPAPEPQITALVPPPAPRWYQRRTVQVGVLATLVAVVAGGYYWAQHRESSQRWDPDIRAPQTNAGGAP